MLILQFNGLRNLNVSLQVGDAVYARRTVTQPGSSDPQAGPVATYTADTTGVNHYIGILRKIDNLGTNQYDLYVDDTVTSNNYTFQPLDFIMFSKYDQSDGDVLGYYAEAKFVNDSKLEAELYVVSSEVIINSK